MNRSILIVTCDFLVLAAMSLSIGVSDVGDPSGGTNIPLPANRLVEMIDEELARQEELKQQKEALEKRLDEFRALALRDEKRIATRESEIAETQEKLAETLEALAKSKNELSAEKTKADQDSAKNAAELAEMKKKLDEREDALKRSAAVITQKEIELELSAQEIMERDKAIREGESLLEEKELNLAQANREKAEANREKAEANEKLQQSERSLSRTSGQLEMARLELDALREQARLDRARADAAAEQLHAREIELVEVKSQLAAAQTQVTGMVVALTELSADRDKTKEALKEKEKEVATAQETIRKDEELKQEKDERIAENQRAREKAEEKAEDLEKKLSNDVLTSYANSALELFFHIRNDRLFNNIEIDKSFFLPSVTIDGKNWIVSAFRDTTGLKLHSGYTTVNELQYKVRRPQSKDKWEIVSGPALCLNEDMRVCLFPVGDGIAKPMQALTFPALSERGVDNLTLFKSGTYSKESADLSGRCSLSLQEDDNYLYIRNPNRSSSELRAEVGDFVLSKEGFFVGVVVKVSSSDLGRTSTARCFVFPNVPDLSKAARLRLTKEPSQSRFFDFVAGHEALRKRTEQLDREK